VTVTPVPVTAVWVDHELTQLNPQYGTSTPPDATSGGLGELLNRLDRFVAFPAATVMLDGTVPAQLGFSGPPPAPGKTESVPLARAREQGWEVREERVWMTFVRKDGGRQERTIHVGIVPWLSPTTFALYAAGDPLLMQWRMYEWTRMLGVPFTGEQVGVSGHNIIRDRCTLKKTPRWHLPANGELIEPARKTTELPFNWRGPQPESGWIFQFDATAQHMAALNNVHVSGDLLQHRKPGEPVRKNPPGYYRVIPPAWSLPRSLPHPIGRLNDDPGTPKWVTHVTLDFLMELHEDYGIVDPPELLDSWTSDYRCRAFRTFGEILSNALRESATYAEEHPEDQVMHTAVKNVYKATVGMMARPGGRIYRPDWTHAVIAQARCDLWRKAWREGSRQRYRAPRTGDVLIGSGAWPVRMETDALWYASEWDIPVWPATFLRGDGLTPGTFVVKKSQEVGAE
jgi:hypothetical protein